jgi:hypothetical protein
MFRQASLVIAGLLCLVAAPILADEAEDAFNSLYGNDYKRVTATPDKADDVALAKQLLDAAKAPGVQPGLLSVLCDNAYELGVKSPAGYETAAEAMELLAQKAPAGAAAALDRVATIREKQYQAVKGPDKADAGEVFIESVLVAAAAHMASGATTEGMALLRKALVAANAIKSDRKNEIQGRIDFAATRLRTEKQVADLKAKVEANPDDAAVRKQLVQACLVGLDAPAEAEVFLNDSSDPSVRKYVPAVSKGVDAAPEIACMELGEWYRGLGEAPGVTPGGKEAMLKRARAYYQRFLNLHKTEDIARNQATLAVKKADEALAKLGPGKGEGIIGPGRWIDLLKLIDLEKDTVEGKGQWKLAEGELLYQGGFPDLSRVSVPCAPAGNYELKVRVACLRGNPDGYAVVLLPVGNTAVAARLLGQGDPATLYGIEKPRDQKVSLTVVDGQEHEFDITVLLARDQADITITSGGKPQLHWQGPLSALRGGAGWQMPDVKLLGLGVESARMAIKSAKLKMLSGKAKLLR